MKIAIGNDQHGLLYKQMLMSAYPEHDYINVGTDSTDPINYPLIGEKVAQLVASGECDRGILICGTGIGMAITANKVHGAYAAVCHDIYSTQRSILSNNANIMCMGALVIGKETAKALVNIWLNLTFDPASHSAKNVAMIKNIEGHAV